MAEKLPKSALMSPVASEYAQIQAAKSAVHDLEVAAAKAIGDLVKAYGPGPHKMPLPDGTSKIVTFRKSGATFLVHAIDMDKID